MNTARVMEDGDLRLPPDVSGKLNAKPGDALAIEIDADGSVRLYPKTLEIKDVCGMLHPPDGVHLTIEEMDEAVAEAFLRDDL